MNVEKIQALEALLGRVQRNAATPRPQANVPAAPSPAAPSPAAQPSNGSRAPELIAVAAVPQPPPRAPQEAPEPILDEGPELISEELTVDDAELLELDVAPERSAEEEAAEPEIEEPPASSRRVAASMDEALAGAARQAERPKTIPPESGPEPVTTGGEFAVGSSAASRAPRVPTTEQLGQTVALEEGPPAEFELDEPLGESVPASEEASQLEAELPSGARGYREGLASPPGAREELERVRLGEVRAAVIARPVISTNVVEFLRAHTEQRPGSFLAMLDEALSLGKE